MDYGERFNYGKIKDDFEHPNNKGYYSSTYTSFDSKLNSIPSLDDLQKQYPDKFKTFHELKTYRWGKGDNFFATYGINKFGEMELLDTNWYDSMPMGNKELKEENKGLKRYIDYLKEKNDTLKKNYRGNKEKNKENERKAKAFDKLYRILFSKFSYHTDIHDIYGVGKFENVKYGQFFDHSMDMEKLTNKEIVSVVNIFLDGINAEYRIEWFGYSGLNEPDNGGSYVSIKVDEQAKKDVHDYNELDKSKTDLTNN